MPKESSHTQSKSRSPIAHSPIGPSPSALAADPNINNLKAPIQCSGIVDRTIPMELVRSTTWRFKCLKSDAMSRILVPWMARVQHDNVLRAQPKQVFFFIIRIEGNGIFGVGMGTGRDDTQGTATKCKWCCAAHTMSQRSRATHRTGRNGSHWERVATLQRWRMAQVGRGNRGQGVR